MHLSVIPPPRRRDGHETRLFTRGVALGSLPLSLLRRPPLAFLLLLPSPGLLFLRPRFSLLVFEILGRFAFVELLPFEVDEGFVGGGVEDVGRVRAGAHPEGAFEG